MSVIPLSDRTAILDLLARAAWAFDERRIDGFAAAFTTDAVIERRHRGAPVVRWRADDDGFAGFLEAELGDVHVADLQTWTSDAVFDRVGSDVIVTSSSLRVGNAAGGTSNVVLADAEVVDRLVATDDGWRIAARVITPLGAEAPPPATSGARHVDPSADDLDDAARDRLEIEALFADYAWALDTADLPGVLELFSDDAVMQDPFGRFTGSGPDGFGAFFRMLFRRPEFAGRIHWVSQLVLTPIDDGYQADSYALVPASFETGGVNIHLQAFYRDVVVRSRGRWAFRERLVGDRDVQR